jgi:hypothetical protein
VNRHDESWGPEPRHYIRATSDGASQWNDVPDWGAELVASDVPDAMHPGERRWVTVLFRNAGDRTWALSGGPTLQARATGGAFGVQGPITPMVPAAEGTRFGGVPRGFPAAFTFALDAPCAAGSYDLSVGLVDAAGMPFGADFVRHIAVAP